MIKIQLRTLFPCFSATLLGTATWFYSHVQTSESLKQENTQGAFVIMYNLSTSKLIGDCLFQMTDVLCNQSAQ